MSKYTKKDREEAAWALAILASNPDLRNTADVLVEHSPAWELAFKAFFATPSRDATLASISDVEQRAEAESWVRTGWTP